MSNVTILIRTGNNEDILERTLKGIMKQKYDGFEVVAIDSNSKDGTLNILKKYNVKTIISPFFVYNPAKVINYALTKINTKYIVFNNSDCVPRNLYWLHNLVKPLKNGKAEVTYCRQTPRKDAWDIVKNDHDKVFSSEKKSLYDQFFSLASSATTKEVLKNYAFSEDMKYSEDVEWVNRIRKDGFRVNYVPNAIVEHSHNYSSVELFIRFFNEGVADSRIYNVERLSISKIAVKVFKTLFKESLLSFISFRDFKELNFRLKYRFVQRVGYLMGTYFNDGSNYLKIRS